MFPSKHALIRLFIAATIAFAVIASLVSAEILFRREEIRRATLSLTSPVNSTRGSFLPVDMQQGIAQVEVTLSEIRQVSQRRGHCNLLVFGLGNDSPFWRDSNAAGTTVFLENSQEWIDRIQERAERGGERLAVHKVDYTTQTGRDAGKYRDGSKRGAWASLMLQLPADVKSKEWDIVIVDGPQGFRKRHPGRWQSIYTAAHLKRPPHALTVIDDCQREIESSFAALVFGRDKLVKRVGREAARGINANLQCYYRGGPANGTVNTRTPSSRNDLSHRTMQKSFPIQSIS